MKDYSIKIYLRKKIISLSVPVFLGSMKLVQTTGALLNNFLMRKSSYLAIEKDLIVLHQDLPHLSDSQHTLRQHISNFSERAKEYRQLLARISNVEQIDQIQTIIDL